jgi:predicted AAA+ superfamily ATPase
VSVFGLPVDTSIFRTYTFKMADIARVAESGIRSLMNRFPCVAVLGARQVGKTTLLKKVLPRAPFYDMERQAEFLRAKGDPDFFLSALETPVVIDEAQKVPELFNALRVAIDNNRKPGRFLISGSGSPELLKGVTESLAGRVAVFELGGFSSEEMWRLPPSPFYDIVKEKRFDDLRGLRPRTKPGQWAEACVSGTYPEPFLKRRDAEHVRLWMENYFDAYIKRDVRDLFPGLNIIAYRTFLQMLAGASGEIQNASNFARSLDVSQPTVKSYWRIAEGTFLWRNLPSYVKNVVQRVAHMPRAHWRDAGLLSHLLRVRSVEELRAHPQVGGIWEGFVIEELVKGFKNRMIACDSFYYRTHNQAEIDLVLEGDFGLLPVEIKWGMKTDPRQVIALRNFVKDHRAPIGLCINNSQRIDWLAPGVLQIPATHL